MSFTLSKPLDFRVEVRDEILKMLNESPTPIIFTRGNYRIIQLNNKKIKSNENNQSAHSEHHAYHSI